MATRLRPSQSIDILRETWSTFRSEPESARDQAGGSKCLINACMDFRYIKTFAARQTFERNLREGGLALAGAGLADKRPSSRCSRKKAAQQDRVNASTAYLQSCSV